MRALLEAAASQRGLRARRARRARLAGRRSAGRRSTGSTSWWRPGTRPPTPVLGTIRHDRRRGTRRPRSTRPARRERHRRCRTSCWPMPTTLRRRCTGGGVVGDGVRRVREQPGAARPRRRCFGPTRPSSTRASSRRPRRPSRRGGRPRRSRGSRCCGPPCRSRPTAPRRSPVRSRPGSANASARPIPVRSSSITTTLRRRSRSRSNGGSTACSTWRPTAASRATVFERCRGNGSGCPLPDRVADVVGRAAVAVPARSDPAGSALVHPRAVGRRQRQAPSRGLGHRPSPTSRPTSRGPRRSGGPWSRRSGARRSRSGR